MGSVVFAFLPLLLRSRFGWLILLGVLGYYVFTNFVHTDAPPAPKTDRSGTETYVTSGANDKQVQFVSFVLDDVQSTWSRTFQERSASYPRAKLVLFDNATQTACGGGRAATGPFYCPADQRVYIDLSFYDQLAKRFGARGDFAQAYVIAHEIGHHVQHVLGTTEKVGRLKSDQKGATSASVRLELQADCYAGIWAKSTDKRKLLEAGDLDEALTAASAIGDDRLQKEASGRVQPESWTHGSAEQRSRWLKRGYEQGTMEACDTFGATSL